MNIRFATAKFLKYCIKRPPLIKDHFDFPREGTV